MRQIITALLGATALSIAGAPGALAADMLDKAPIYKAPPGTVVYASDLYLSADGAWQRVHLPTYALGFRNVAEALPRFDQGVISPFDQRFNGSSIRGAIGYIFPTGTFSPMFGTNVRAELGASYGSAKGTQSAASAQSTDRISLSLLDGSGQDNAFTCNGGVSCTTNSTQSSDYSSWQINGKFASDFRTGGVTLTPSLAVFGGRARNNQTLSQTFAQFLGVVPTSNIGTYNASTSLSWSDIGARVGLDGNVDVNNWMALGLGGYAGFASRRASLSGNDIGADFVGVVFSGASTLSTGANTTAFVANAEASVTFKATPAVAIRAFTGVNYDSRVPGISSPSFAGNWVAPTSRTAAGITFQSEASYYAGGRVTVKF